MNHSFLKNRIFALLLTVILLIPVVCATSLVGSCYTGAISGDRQAYPGGTVTLRLTFDTEVTGYMGYLEYDASVLELTKIESTDSDLEEDLYYDYDFNYAMIAYTEPVTKVLKVTFTVLDGVEPGSSTDVRFTGGEVINDFDMESVEDSSFTVNIVKKKSSDAKLKSMSVTVFEGSSDKNGTKVALDPAFSSRTTSYNATVSNEYTRYEIKASCNDSAAEITSKIKGELKEGSNTITITVRAEDGSEKKYTVKLVREEPPQISQEPSEEPSEPNESEESEFSEETPSQDESVEESFPEESDTSEETSTEESGGMIGTTSETSEDTSSADTSSEETTSDETSEEPQAPFWTRIDRNTWIVIGVIAGILLMLILLLVIQWKRTAKRKSIPVKEDYVLDCEMAIATAKSNLKNGLIRCFRSEFGNRIPENPKALYQFVLSAFAQRMGSPYVAVENLIPYLQKVSGISLRGTDSVGGAYVLPVVVNENGERSFRVEGLIITFKKGNYQYSETCHLRIYADRGGQPIEEVLSFES